MCEEHDPPPSKPRSEPDDNITILYGDDQTMGRARRAAAHHFEGDATKIAVAMDEYQGTFVSLEEYARLEIEEHIAPAMSWLLDGYVDLTKIAQDWVRLGRNWALPDKTRESSEPTGLHVFLSSKPTNVQPER